MYQKYFSELHNHTYTLESVIDVGQGISIGPGRFVKKNKRRACRIWEKKITVGQEKIDKKNKFDQKKFSKLMWEKKSYLKELLCWNKSDLTKCANCISLEKFPKNNKRRAFNKAIGPGKKFRN